jgi:FkbM family methyltransferase
VEKKWLFDRQWTRDFTGIRQKFIAEFLESVRPQIGRASALDVGCGVGDFSKFLSDVGFSVTAVDGREENVTEARRRYPNIKFLARNAEDFQLEEMGKFDLVLCVGLLYHLENPFRAVRNLHALTRKVLFVESMCAPGVDPSMKLVDESPTEDQGLNYVAFYPTESCLVKMLYHAGFPFVYGFMSLPDHELFHAALFRRKQRTMLLASTDPLTAPGLKLMPRLAGSWEILAIARERFRTQVGHLASLLKKPRRDGGNIILGRNGITGTWIDVGAHHGERTLGYARRNPGLQVYAFEPNLCAAAKLIGRAPNYVVIPMAIAEKNGCADFYVNDFDSASSLLPLNDEGVRSWKAASVLRVNSITTVPTVRLDTFMNAVGIRKVDFLKIDAQGADLSVIRSAGSRLRDVSKIMAEVWIAPTTLYAGAPTKEQVVSYLKESGFDLEGAETQSEGHEENLTFVKRQKP